MALTLAELEILLTQWVKDYCRDSFLDGLPAGVQIFIDKALNYYTTTLGVTSESLGDYSVTLEKGISGLPTSLTSLLIPYRRLRGLR